jgi:hypothetical protein
MSPDEIRDLRSEVNRVSPDLITAKHVRPLLRALGECLELIALMRDPTDVEDVVERRLELLLTLLEPLPGKLPPALVGTIVYVEPTYGIVRCSGRNFRFSARDAIDFDIAKDPVGKKVEFDIKPTKRGPRAVSVRAVE